MRFRCRDCEFDFTATLADGSCPDCYKKESVEERAPLPPENPPVPAGFSAGVAARKEPTSATLYVADLAPEVTEAMLFEKFSTAGAVLSIRVCRDKLTRRSLGYAYVNFQIPSDAARAMDTLNYDPLKGRPMRIMWSQRDPTLRHSGSGNIFVKGLDVSVDNKLLYDTVSRFGSILSCKVAMDEQERSRGHAFVQFESETAAQEAIRQVNGSVIGGQEVFVGRFISRAERERGQRQGVNLIIKNLDESVNDQTLQTRFAQFGNITSSKVMMENGHSKGYGFVCYATSESASRAIQEMHGKVLGSLAVSVEVAPRKEERPALIFKQSAPPRFVPSAVNSAALNLTYAPRPQPPRFRPGTARPSVTKVPVIHSAVAPVPAATRMPAAPMTNRNGIFQNRPAGPAAQTAQSAQSNVHNPQVSRYPSQLFAPIPPVQPICLGELSHSSRTFTKKKKSCAAKKWERQAAAGALQKPIIPVVVETKSTTPTVPLKENDDRKCCVCLDLDKCILFRPCRHVAVCVVCSDKVATCPICRKDVQEREPIFL